jgi:hypothetical protein
MKKVILILMMFILVTTMPVMASTNEREVESNVVEKTVSTIHISGAKYSNIFSIDGRLSISSFGKASVGATIDGGKDVEKVSVIAELQQYKNGEWVEIKTWERYNPYDGILILGESYYVAKGYEYRVVLDIEVFDKDGKSLDSTTAIIPKQHY